MNKKKNSFTQITQSKRKMKIGKNSYFIINNYDDDDDDANDNDFVNTHDVCSLDRIFFSFDLSIDLSIDRSNRLDWIVLDLIRIWFFFLFVYTYIFIGRPKWLLWLYWWRWVYNSSHGIVFIYLSKLNTHTSLLPCTIFVDDDDDDDDEFRS